MALLALPARATFAQPPEDAKTATDESPAARAVELGRLGRTRFDAEDWAGALAAFEEAESLVHSPVFVLHMARCELRLGHADRARALYRSVAEEELPADAPVQWKNAQTEARAELPLVAPPPEPPKPDPQPPDPQPPDPRHPDAQQLEPQPPAPVPALPTPPPPLAPQPAATPDEMSTFATIAIVLTTVGGAGVVAGAIAGGVALDRSASARDACEARRRADARASCADLADDHDGATTLAHASTGLLVGGSAALVAGVVMLLLAPRPESEERVSVTALPHGIGVVLRF